MEWKVGNQEIPGVTDKLVLRVKKKKKISGAKANRILPRQYTGHGKHPLFNNTRDNFIDEHHQMVNIKIRLTTFFVTEDGETISQQN